MILKRQLFLLAYSTLLMVLLLGASEKSVVEATNISEKASYGTCNVSKETKEAKGNSITTTATTSKEVVTTTNIISKQTTKKAAKTTKKWKGEVLNATIGTVQGPSGKETYYNLDMSKVVKIMKQCGYNYKYYVRDDGVKMYGPYVMCAANLEIRPRGTIIETSLGKAIVCDTGGFAKVNPTQVDIAVNW